MKAHIGYELFHTFIFNQTASFIAHVYDAMNKAHVMLLQAKGK